MSNSITKKLFSQNIYYDLFVERRTFFNWFLGS